MFTTTGQTWMLNTTSGTSPVQTYHWLQNMAALGVPDTSVTADTPLYAVFRVPATSKTTDGVRRILVAYNEDETERIVTFSNGVQATAPPNAIIAVEHVAQPPVLLPVIFDSSN